MPNGEPSVGEVWRTFLDFRAETREELKWLRRLLIGTLASAILGSLISSVFVVVVG